MNAKIDSVTANAAIAATEAWLEKAVIGLGLCPFAKPVHVGRRIRYLVSEAETEPALRDELGRELELLAAADPSAIETTLLIHPRVLLDFLAYNSFLPAANALLKKQRLVGVIQVASFHPDYQFADAPPDDPGNFTNRSPFPMLHLLREDSVARAVQSHPDAAGIPAANVATLRRLGRAGWDRLWRGRS